MAWESMAWSGEVMVGVGGALGGGRMQKQRCSSAAVPKAPRATEGHAHVEAACSCVAFTKSNWQLHSHLGVAEDALARLQVPAVTDLDSCCLIASPLLLFRL
jgi:hypothetical protein